MQNRGNHIANLLHQLYRRQDTAKLGIMKLILFCVQILFIGFLNTSCKSLVHTLRGNGFQVKFNFPRKVKNRNGLKKYAKIEDVFKKIFVRELFEKNVKTCFFTYFHSALSKKIVLMRIDPYSSPMMLMIISDGKNGPKTRENSQVWQG